MKTIRMQVAYDGSAYHGWQIQSRDRSVEEALTKALMRILNADEPVKVQGASRTDSGVHSLGQVAHFRHDTDRTPWELIRGLNGLTDDDICVMRLEEASDDFHARFSAEGKIYRYRVWNHRFPHPFLKGRAWHIRRDLDVEAMQAASELFLGHHDFAGFRSSNCSSGRTERTVDRVEVRRQGKCFVEIIVQGQAFLQYMVRIMSGTLVEIGMGRLDASAIEKALESGNRSDAGLTAPSRGLELVEVFYPDFEWKGDKPTLGGAILAEHQYYVTA